MSARPSFNAMRARCWLACILLVGVAAAGDKQSSIDEKYLCPDQLSTARQLPNLKLESNLRSSKNRVETDITLVTQLSFERLYMLEGQCDVWTGIISAAVYVALVDGKAVSVELSSNQDPSLVELTEVKQAVARFHMLAEQRGLCKLDLQLVSQEVESVWLSGLYPVNSMRNRALAGADTDVVLLLDVDFWPSAELSELMANPRKYASLLQAVNQRTAVVLAAFESGETGAIGVEQAREAVLRGKTGAAAMSRDGRLKPFHTDRYRAGHRATDYARWTTAKQPYAVRYEEGYEPYVLVARRYVPWYDERFIGYRKNKVVHLLHVSTLGLTFVAHPNAFVVHSPHPRARTWKVTRKTGLWDQLATIYLDVKTALQHGDYVPAAMYSCAEHLVGPMLSETTLPPLSTEQSTAVAQQQQAGATES